MSGEEIKAEEEAATSTKAALVAVEEAVAAIMLGEVVLEGDMAVDMADEERKL